MAQLGVKLLELVGEALAFCDTAVVLGEKLSESDRILRGNAHFPVGVIN